MIRGRLRKIGAVSLVRFRRWRGGIRWWPAAFQIVAIVFVLVVAIAPYMRSQGRSWTSWRSWSASFREAWLLLLPVLYLRYEEKFRRFFNERKIKHAWKVRMAGLARLLDSLRHPDLRMTQEVARFRRDVLGCVVSGVAEITALPAESLYANLINLTSDKRMEVAARSDADRKPGVVYEAVAEYLPWRAIRDAKIEVDHDYQARQDVGSRPYRSIIALPVVRGDRAYGCLSINCTIAYAFYGHEDRVAYQVRPYLSLLALTYGEKSPYHECAFDPAYR